MLINSPPLFRKRPGRAQEAAARAPVALTLVSATYDADAPGVFLTFDREIDLSGINVGAFVVLDGINGNHMLGSGAPERVSPAQVLVYFVFVEPYAGPDVLLTAGADNGIVAMDDGGVWEGASDLGLPFP
jgi:hypothetical protein